MTAKCPKCGHTTHTPSFGKDRWYCHDCQMEFESEDDGDVGYGSPSRRLERQERQSLKHRRVMR